MRVSSCVPRCGFVSHQLPQVASTSGRSGAMAHHQKAHRKQANLVSLRRRGTVCANSVRVLSGSRPGRSQVLRALHALDPTVTSTTDSAPFVTPDDMKRGEIAREWISELYDNVDYSKVFDAMDGDDETNRSDDDLFDSLAQDDDDDPERMYGEFDMGFFIGLIKSLERDICNLEYGDVDGGAVTNGVFCDVGSGRGQICFLASVLRSWRRCVGLEIDPQLHTIAEQVTMFTTPDAKDKVVSPEFLESFPVAGRPSRQSPVSFVNGSMYDRNDLSATLENATVVFMFSTKFEVVGGGEVVGEFLNDDEDHGSNPGGDSSSSSALKPAVKTLKVGSFIRPHLRIGALVVTVNAVLSRNDGYALLRQEHGPDAEKVGGSTAYVWRVTEVTCDDADGGVSKKKKKTKQKVVT